MSKLVTYDRFKKMWLEITNEQRQQLKDAYVQRYQSRIDFQDKTAIDNVNAVIATKKLTTQQAFLMYVAAMAENVDRDWFFTSKQVYWSPTKRIYTGHK